MKKSNLILIAALVIMLALFYWKANAGGDAGAEVPIDDIIVADPIEDPIDDVVIIDSLPPGDELTEEWVLRAALNGGIDLNTGSVTLQVATMEDAWHIKELFDNYYIGNYRVEWSDKRIYLNDPALFITWRE